MLLFVFVCMCMCCCFSFSFFRRLSLFYPFVLTLFNFNLEGPQLVLQSGVQQNPAAAIYESPWYNRSEDWYGSCLKFKYKLHGPGAKSLRLYQKLPYDFVKQPIWVDYNSTDNVWKHAQVSLTTVSRYKVRLIIPVWLERISVPILLLGIAAGGS